MGWLDRLLALVAGLRTREGRTRSGRNAPIASWWGVLPVPASPAFPSLSPPCGACAARGALVGAIRP